MLSFLLPLLALSYEAAALWPLPTTQSLGNSTLWISDDVSIDVVGTGNVRDTFFTPQSVIK
jgi:hypothetical protein